MGLFRKIIRKHRKYNFDKGNFCKFSHDELFDMSKFDVYFANHQDDVDDTSILERICVSYQKSKNDQSAAKDHYQVSNEWLPIYRKYYGPVMAALSNSDIKGLRDIYKNFWRNSSSAGLIGLSFDMQSFFDNTATRKNKEKYLFDVIHRYRLWQQLVGHDAAPQQLDSPLIGNPYGIFVGDHFVKAGADYLHYYSYLIGALVDRIANPVVVELGGGYGGMAYYLTRDFPRVKYFDFDLPENAALTAYYLLRSCKDKHVLLYGERDLSTDILADYDVVIMPNYCISYMPDKSSDVVFNSYSLAEMDRKAIGEYISIIQRISKEWICHVNHTRNSIVGADEFGIDRGVFNMLSRSPAMWNAARNQNMDEYEYIFRRICR